MFCATFRHFTRFWCWFLPGKNCIGAFYVYTFCMSDALCMICQRYDFLCLITDCPIAVIFQEKNTVSTYPLRSWRPCHVPFQPASSLGKGHGGGKLTANLCSSLVQPSLLDKWQMREDWTAIFLGWILPWFLESNIRAASCQFIS